MEGKLSGAEQAELGRLQGAVSQIENALRFSAGMDAATIGALSTFLAHLQGRLAGLEAKAEQQAKEDRTQADQEARISALVERERALNEAEKQEYASFLSEDHFKKADFDRLEHFYSHSWDKLTEEGKDEMSKRVWEGVRQHEYRFGELPEPVKEKEAQRVELGLKRGGSENFAAISAQDKSDFMDARARGQKEESYTILDRPTFAQHVAVSKEHSTKVDVHGEAAAVQKTDTEAAKTPPSTKAEDVSSRKGNIKFSLDKLQIVDGHEADPRAPLTGYTGNSTATVPPALPGR